MYLVRRGATTLRKGAMGFLGLFRRRENPRRVSPQEVEVKNREKADDVVTSAAVATGDNAACSKNELSFCPHASFS